jgi:hypothetical protein
LSFLISRWHDRLVKLTTCLWVFFIYKIGLILGETLRTGPQPQVPAPQSNNHQSGFKRQNTVDSATIKENSARLNARPASAQAKTATENSKFVKITNTNC